LDAGTLDTLVRATGLPRPLAALLLSRGHASDVEDLVFPGIHVFGQAGLDVGGVSSREQERGSIWFAIQL
jgi:hypothetical protein